MFNFIPFLEGFVAGFLFAGIITIAIYFQLKDIAEAIRNPKPKPTISKDILGRIEQAQIVKKIDKIDELLGE